MPDPERPCPQCGGDVPSASAECPRCGAAVPPPLPDPAKPPAIESWFEGPEPPLPAPAGQELVILDEPEGPAAEEVPVVRPARVEALPEARPLPASRPSEFPWPTRPPARNDEPVEKPKPQLALALVVVLLLTLATCGGVFVITYAIWAGFKRFAPTKRAEAPADVRSAPALRAGPAAR
jgi:hypothetical protein